MSSTLQTPNLQPTAIIVEDENALREELKEALQSLWPELNIVGEARNGPEALRLIGQHRPDIAFLDINIPGISGLEVARRIDKCHVVFVTAYDAHFAEAFEQGTVDYVMKPVSNERLLITIRRLQEKLLQSGANFPKLAQRDQHPQAPPAYLRCLTATVGNSIRMIPIEDVVYFQIEQKYVRIVLADSTALIRKSLTELLADLDPQQFWQVHRSTVVQFKEIVSVDLNFAGQPVIKLKSRSECLPVTNAFISRFRQIYLVG